MKRAAGRAIKIAIEILAVLIVIGLFLPTNFVVLRTTSIAAPTESIYPLVNDLTQWQRWEPWSEMDPSIKISRGDITQGVGATQSWVGNDGSGSLRITHSSPETGIAYDLSFDSGRHSCESELFFQPSSEGTKVTWVLHGDTDIPVIGPFLAMFISKMTGPIFEHGLANLKRTAEGA